tara:strand:- start:1926 stop:3542 length:1617 start_codon:yes stop_codon:yes gene_type:complete
MAVKYLDLRARGNDNGSSITNAYPTWALAKAGVAAGDVVYIAPGTYCERVTLATDGTAAAKIKWIGDVNSEIFTTVSPGTIVLTQSTTDEVLESSARTGPTLNMNGIDFQEFYNITFIGPSAASSDLTGNNTAVWYSTAEGAYFRNCHFQAGFAGVAYAKDGTFVECLFTGCFVGVYGVGSNNRPTVVNCVAICGGNGFVLVAAYNCLAIAGKRGFQNSNMYGCTTAGGEYGMYTTSADSVADNCVSWANYFPFAASATNKLNLRGSVSYGSAYRTFVSISGSGHYHHGGQDATAHRVDSRFSAYPTTTIIPDFTAFMKLRDVFIPSHGKGMVVSASLPIAQDFEHGSTRLGAFTSQSDMNGNIVNQLSHPYEPFYGRDYKGTERVISRTGFPSPPGIHAIVPLQAVGMVDATSSAAVTGMVSQSSPAIVHRGRGESVFEIPLPSGSYFTASVNVKHTGSTAASYAQMVISSSRINQSSGSLFGAFATESKQTVNDFTFRNLELRIPSVGYDTTYILKLQSPSTGSYATASFSDLTIS